MGAGEAEKTILGLEEAATLFGVSVKTFIKLLREESVPARKIGREWRFSREALIRWLGQGDSRRYTDSEQETVRFFDQLATQGEPLRMGISEPHLLDLLQRDACPEPGQQVLDYGAGDGLVARWAVSRGAYVTAMDVAPRMLVELQRRARAEGLEGLDTLECIPGEVPLPDNSRDWIYASLLVHHLEEPDYTLKEFFRVIKPGGRLGLVEYMPYDAPNLQGRLHDRLPGIEPDHLAEWLETAGFITPGWEEVRTEGETVRAYLMTARKAGS